MDKPAEYITFKSINISTHIKSSDELLEKCGRWRTKRLRIPEQYQQTKRDDRKAQRESEDFSSLKG